MRAAGIKDNKCIVMSARLVGTTRINAGKLWAIPQITRIILGKEIHKDLLGTWCKKTAMRRAWSLQNLLPHNINNFLIFLTSKELKQQTILLQITLR